MIIDEQRLDIYFPDRDVGLVLYTHSDEAEKNLSKIHGLLNITSHKIIHLWEDIWIYHQEKVKSRLLSLVGKSQRIYARETQLETIDNARLLEFLEINHLNVPIKAKYKYGLFYRDEPVAVMSFSKSRMIERDGKLYNSHELLRFCNKLDVTVVGGMTKLLKHFIRTQHPDDIMTYVDCDWSDGQANRKAGFEMMERITPMEFWLDLQTGRREYPRYILRKKGVGEEILNDKNRLDSFMKEHQLVTVYNSGSYKFLLKLK